MSEALVVSLRAMVILAFLAVMPLLAIPAVGQKYDAWLRANPVGAQRTPEESKTPQTKKVGERPSEPAPAAHDESPVESQPTAVTSREGERFEAIPQILRELGADYLKLEAVDAAGTSYRFECRMPLTENSTYSRPFAAVATDPVEAMERVLAGVEAWQAARHLGGAAHSTGRPR